MHDVKSSAARLRWKKNIGEAKKKKRLKRLKEENQLQLHC